MAIEKSLISEFTLVGKLKDIVIDKKDRVEYLYLTSDLDSYWIEVTKELRDRLKKLKDRLQPGCKLKVEGKRKYKASQQKFSYKAKKVKLTDDKQHKSVIDSSSKEDCSKVKSKAKVLFCQKSSCWKNGGKAACENLQQELKNRGLDKQVTIQKTGCLKQCKKAPNMVLMPDKARYSKVKPKQVVKLIDKHLLVGKN